MPKKSILALFANLCPNCRKKKLKRAKNRTTRFWYLICTECPYVVKDTDMDGRLG